MDIEEEWKPLNQTSDYDISNHGRVRSHRIRKNEPVILKGSTCDTRHQYSSVNIFLKSENRYRHFYIHKLVAEHFVDNPDVTKYVDHIDGNRQNNYSSNLRWVTNQQNQLNKKTQTNNTSGVTGVRCRVRGSITRWIASWTDTENKYCTEAFNTKEQAIKCRQDMVKQHYDMEFYSEDKKNEIENEDGNHPNYQYFLDQRELFTSTTDNFENEEWKMIPNTDNKYQISTYGRIKSFRKKLYADKGEILQTSFDQTNIAIRAEIFVSKNISEAILKKYQMSVHKMVAEAFIHNDDPINKKCIDHIDGNRCNNRVENLRWVSYQQNNHNRALSKVNKSGVKGVHFNKFTNKHVATWRDENGKHCHQSFIELQDAVQHRQKMVDKYYDKNFYKI